MPKIDARLKRAAKAPLAVCLGFVLSCGLGLGGLRAVADA
jgi:hypothetical protein